MSIGSFPGDIMRWNVLWLWQLGLKHGWCLFYPDICLYNIKTWLNLFLALNLLSWYICRLSSFWSVSPNLYAESRGGSEYMGWQIGSILLFNAQGNAPRTTSLLGTPHTARTYTQLKFLCCVCRRRAQLPFYSHWTTGYCCIWDYLPIHVLIHDKRTQLEVACRRLTPIASTR